MSRAAGKTQDKETYKGDWDVYICQRGLQPHPASDAMITMKKLNNPSVVTIGYSIARAGTVGKQMKYIDSETFTAMFHGSVARFRPDHILTVQGFKKVQYHVTKCTQKHPHTEKACEAVTPLFIRLLTACLVLHLYGSDPK